MHAPSRGKARRGRRSHGMRRLGRASLFCGLLLLVGCGKSSDTPEKPRVDVPEAQESAVPTPLWESVRPPGPGSARGEAVHNFDVLVKGTGPPAEIVGMQEGPAAPGSGMAAGDAARDTRTPTPAGGSILHLPETFDEVVCGGQGRFLIMKLNRMRKLATLQRRDVAVSGTRHVRFADGIRVMASADGRTFACWRTAVSPTGLQLLAVSDDQVLFWPAAE